jgi:hypothetical protein
VSAVSHQEVRRDGHGVLLRYPSHDVGRPYQTEQRPQVSDRRRIALIKAERALVWLQIIVDHLDVSDLGLTHIGDALESIRIGLEVKRRDGMGTVNA